MAYPKTWINCCDETLMVDYRQGTLFEGRCHLCGTRHQVRIGNKYYIPTDKVKCETCNRFHDVVKPPFSDVE